MADLSLCPAVRRSYLLWLICSACTPPGVTYGKFQSMHLWARAGVSCLLIYIRTVSTGIEGSILSVLTLNLQQGCTVSASLVLCLLTETGG